MNLLLDAPPQVFSPNASKTLIRIQQKLRDEGNRTKMLAARLKSKRKSQRTASIEGVQFDDESEQGEAAAAAKSSLQDHSFAAETARLKAESDAAGAHMARTEAAEDAAAARAARIKAEAEAAGGLDAEAIEALIAERKAAKANKDYAESDRIRDELKAQGISLIDKPRGEVLWTRD